MVEQYAPSQGRARALVLELDEMIRQADDIYEKAKRHGDKSKRKKALAQRNELVLRKSSLIEKINEERRQVAFHLLKCFVSADLCTVEADDFADILHKNSYGQEPDDNDFSALMRQLAHNFNQAVQQIDKVNSLSMSVFYSDMAEECVEAAKDAVTKVIKKWMDTEKGKQYF